MNDYQARRILRQDLYNELRWMLVAASERKAMADCDANDRGHFPGHFDVVTMDSTLVHARALYEFFLTPKTGWRSDTAYAERDYNVKVNATQLWIAYHDTLNKRLFHIDIERPAPVKKVATRTRLANTRIKTDVNARVVEIAQDVLNLWDEFAKAVRFRRVAAKARGLAIDDAANAAASVGGAQVFF